MERRSDDRSGELCPTPDADGAQIEALRERLLDVAGLSELFRVLADETRTKILYLLAQEELCVHDLAQILDLTLPTISHHLRLMRLMRLVKSRRDGRHVYYALADDHVLQLIQTAQEHYQEEE
ncbi:MAG: metalloregulator ArsR/SmtB family transcription factor [Symbiobacteriaceae bacterium]|nr:MAG: transcriptional regulator [Bacillota bacterium]